jgi:large-conductance mechanosensitive channel
MFGSNVLDVAIGLVFVYLMVSLICTVVNEIISSLLNKRGKNLFLGVKNLLNDPSFTGLAQQVYNHGMIDGISKNASDITKGL